MEYVRELKKLTIDIIEERIVGEKTEIPMDIMEGIEIYSVKGRCVIDYCCATLQNKSPLGLKMTMHFPNPRREIHIYDCHSFINR